MKKIIKLLDVVLLILCISLIGIKLFYKEPTEMQIRLQALKLDNVDNLMFVAHPDDESLWGGAHLIDEDYLVVCVTCGQVEEREEEFENAMRATNDEFISLNYPDKTNGEKDNWILYYSDIENDIREIINYKDWEKVVTHNPDGEYGHIHHQMTSNIVTNETKKEKLYYFNTYYTKKDLEKLDGNLNYCLNGINEIKLEEKEELLTLYPSQKAIVNNHHQTIKYEKFIPFSDYDVVKGSNIVKN